MEFTSAVPTPNPSKGAPSASSWAMRSSSRSPEAKMIALCQPAWSMPFAGPFAVGSEISAIEANPPGLAPHGNDFFHRRADVVSVHQENGLIGKDVEELAEGFPFVLVRHDPGVRLRAVDVNSELQAGGNIGGAQAAADHRRARGQNPRFGAVGAAGARIRSRFFRPRPASRAPLCWQSWSEN